MTINFQSVLIALFSIIYTLTSLVFDIYMIRSRIFNLLLGVFLVTQLQAQSDTTYLTDYLESYLEGGDSDGSFDFNTLFEDLAYYRKNPIDINKCQAEELEILGLLTDLQIQSFFSYRTYAGKFIAIQEIQAIPNWDLKTIRTVIPFLDLRNTASGENISLGQRIKNSDHEIFLRWSREIQDKKGFIEDDDGERKYLGSKDQIYVRYRMRFDRFWSAGFTAEKDAGETFFKDPNKAGFDYYSVHAFARNLNPWLKAVALGDYSVSMGQGLILHSGFGGGKSSLVTQIKKNGILLRPYTSVSESNYRRGAAAELAFGNNWTLMAFGSYLSRDANLSQIDTLFGEDEIQTFSSLQTSGLHRTESEIADKHAIKQTSIGTTLRYRKDALQVSVNGVYDHFDKPLLKDQQLYNQFQFNGNTLAAGSIDYSYGWRNIHFFGETAMSDNKKMATLNGAIIAVDRKVDVALVYRNFSAKYQSILSNPFSEGGSASNEEGIYAGIVVRPSRPWEINVFYDQWRHPWLKYQVDAPSQGREIFCRTSFSIRRKLTTYLQYRIETKDKNDPFNDGPIASLIPHTRQYIRWQMNYTLMPGIELRTRIEHSQYKTGESKSSGWLIYQDLVAKPLGKRYSMSTRVALFDTEDYNSRFYTFENDLINDYSVPALYGKGVRFYLNLRYQGIRNLSIEARYSLTRFSNQEEIGSGNDLIAGPLRSELKAQMIYRF
ncbi:MAG: helix-hairpin-helix domain-containing protein [Saprospiraceae bacterium]